MPPHSIEAEQGVLGCILLDPAACLPLARTAFGVTQPFFDLGHEEIFRACCGLFDDVQGIDVITVKQRLHDTGTPVNAERLAYLAGLPDKVPGASHLDYYLNIVRQKFIARQGIAAAKRFIDSQFAFEGSVETMLAQTQESFTQLAAAAAAQVNTNALPPHVKTCESFGEQFHNSFYGADAEEPGTPLPFAHENFPFKIRDSELTLVLGEKGVGKSTILGWVELHLMHYQWKGFDASMEMRPEHTLKIKASQLLGKNKFEDTPENHRLTSAALSWLNQRLVIYDFLGITDWRELIAAMRYAAEFMGCNLFVVDSMMRLGIMDDDYAQQGQCVMEFANFAMQFRSHVFLVNHLNKAQDRSAKARSRGSQQLIDNAHNVVSLQRNEKKGEKLAELWSKRKSDLAAMEAAKKTPAAYQAYYEEFDEKKAELESQWDSKFVLHNQRLPGSRQNGSIYLWFHRESQQMRSDPREAVGVNLLERWSARPTTTQT